MPLCLAMSTREREGLRAPSRRRAVELTIEPRVRSLGEFDVRRVLPAAKRRMVGPFVFLDHMGPAVFPPGHGIAVRPHPHIGLATITYLFEGEIMHRDSLGFGSSFKPGAVNLMTAGRGIVHSERAGDDLAVTSRLHGIQSWIALPLELEEMEPTFLHYPATSLPERQIDGCTVRVIMGSAYGLQSPVLTYSPTLYLEAALPSGARPRACSTRLASAPSTSSQAASRSAAKRYREGTLAVLRAGRRGAAASRGRRSRAGRRRRAARAAAHLVELRLELRSAHRARQARLGRDAHGHRARRRRVHPAARELIGA